MLTAKLRDIVRARKTVVVCASLLATTGWDADTYTATTADTQGGVGPLWLHARLTHAWETRMLCGLLLGFLRVGARVGVTPGQKARICVLAQWYAHGSLTSRLFEYRK